MANGKKGTVFTGLGGDRGRGGKGKKVARKRGQDLNGKKKGSLGCLNHQSQKKNRNPTR